MDNGDQDVDVGTWFSNLLHDQWVTVPVAGRRPPGRYKHAAAVAGERLFISGGSRNGRHLSDIQVLDFTNTTWSSLKLPAASSAAENDSLVQVFPATSGHHMIVWGQKLLLLDGHSKYSSCVTVLILDLETQECGVMETIGEIPVAREGESVTLVGSKLIVFGGEDIHRKLLNDIYILDLDTMTWNKVEATQNPPSPRYDHAATVHAERYLLVFGGSSHSTCFNDLYVLDLETMEWSQPETRGDYVSPRAGHSGITVHGNWYIVGGGDNKSGALDTLVLDMTKLVWSVVTSVKPRDPLARKQLDSTKTENTEVEGAGQKQDGFSGTTSVKDAKRLLELSLAEVREENSKLKGKIDEINSNHEELSKELASVQGQLISERSRCFKLEAQTAELQGMLESLPSVEAEVQSLRKEKFFTEQVEHNTAVQRQGSRGVWQWFSGGESSP
uniref:Acyl-CoA-binding domain-containing protein n=1 Tax=Chenopodium quinoa TaxID=63459 RepID=A0A803N7P4_CHEQI